ncbi:hypothetical protein MBLNU230_g2613t1 [Neophaeotheca triangularis]
MPALSGEKLLTTLFADVHYFFSDPTTKPQHHRFDRGSYVYVYQNLEQHTAKLEIANHAGTPEQDAFSGYLDRASIKYSYKQPGVCGILVDGASMQGHSQWHLPSYNERNEQKYLYRIHSLDIYLWTERDGTALLGHLKNVMPADRMNIRDTPQAKASPAEHRDSMSPVVQQLEKASIGAQFPPRTESASTAQSLPGPPTPASTGASSTPQASAPMAYNPAAPPAPEPIAHREKTPPPPEDGNSAGLSGAPKQQYASTPAGGFPGSGQATPQQSYFTGPPSQSNNHPGASAFPGPPQRSASGSVPGSFPPPPPGGPSPSQQSSYSPSNFQSGQQTPLQSPGLPPPPSSQPPPGDYSNYNYQQQQAQSGAYNALGGYAGNTHSQVYRPTESEAPFVGEDSEKQQQPRPQAQSEGSQGRLRLEDRMQGFEKGMGRFFKKIDRKI